MKGLKVFWGTTIQVLHIFLPHPSQAQLGFKELVDWLSKKYDSKASSVNKMLLFSQTESSDSITLSISFNTSGGRLSIHDLSLSLSNIEQFSTETYIT